VVTEVLIQQPAVGQAGLSKRLAHGGRLPLQDARPQARRRELEDLGLPVLKRASRARSLFGVGGLDDVAQADGQFNEGVHMGGSLGLIGVQQCIVSSLFDRMASSFQARLWTSRIAAHMPWPRKGGV
jgi:hypothetical protein